MINNKIKFCSILVIKPDEPTGEEIELSEALISSILLKNPICGKSDYSDLPGVSLSGRVSWRSFHDFGRRRDRETSPSLTEELRRRSAEARHRQKIKREEVLRQREERRERQRAQRRERKRQQQIIDKLQNSSIASDKVGSNSGVIISSSPRKFSPVKKQKIDRDSYLYDKFKANIIGTDNIPEGSSSLDKKNQSLVKEEEVKKEVRIVSKKGRRRFVDSDTEEVNDTILDDSESTETSESGDSSDTNFEDYSDGESDDANAVSSSSNNIKTVTTRQSKANRTNKFGSSSLVSRSLPEIVDADSSTSSRRQTRRGKRVNYAEMLDDDIDDAEFSSPEPPTSPDATLKVPEPPKKCRKMSGGGLDSDAVSSSRQECKSQTPVQEPVSSSALVSAKMELHFLTAPSHSVAASHRLPVPPAAPTHTVAPSASQRLPVPPLIHSSAINPLFFPAPHPGLLTMPEFPNHTESALRSALSRAHLSSPLKNLHSISQVEELRTFPEFRSAFLPPAASPLPPTSAVAVSSHQHRAYPAAGQLTFPPNFLLESQPASATKTSDPNQSMQRQSTPSVSTGEFSNIDIKSNKHMNDSSLGKIEYPKHVDSFTVNLNHEHQGELTHHFLSSSAKLVGSVHSQNSTQPSSQTAKKRIEDLLQHSSHELPLREKPHLASSWSFGFTPTSHHTPQPPSPYDKLVDQTPGACHRILTAKSPSVLDTVQPITRSPFYNSDLLKNLVPSHTSSYLERNHSSSVYQTTPSSSVYQMTPSSSVHQMTPSSSVHQMTPSSGVYQTTPSSVSSHSSFTPSTVITTRPHGTLCQSPKQLHHNTADNSRVHPYSQNPTARECSPVRYSYSHLNQVPNYLVSSPKAAQRQSYPGPRLSCPWETSSAKEDSRQSYPTERVPSVSTSMQNFETHPLYSQQSPVRKTPTYQSPVQKTPTYQSPVQKTPTYQSPVQNTPTHQSPIQKTPTYQSPIQNNMSYQSPIHKKPTNQSPTVPSRHPYQSSFTSPSVSRPSQLSSSRASSSQPENFEFTGRAAMLGSALRNPLSSLTQQLMSMPDLYSLHQRESQKPGQMYRHNTPTSTPYNPSDLRQTSNRQNPLLSRTHMPPLIEASTIRNSPLNKYNHPVSNSNPSGNFHSHLQSQGSNQHAGGQMKKSQNLTSHQHYPELSHSSHQISAPACQISPALPNKLLLHALDLRQECLDRSSTQQTHPPMSRHNFSPASTQQTHPPTSRHNFSPATTQLTPANTGHRLAFDYPLTSKQIKQESYLSSCFDEESSANQVPAKTTHPSVNQGSTRSDFSVASNGNITRSDFSVASSHGNITRSDFSVANIMSKTVVTSHNAPVSAHSSSWIHPMRPVPESLPYSTAPPASVSHGQPSVSYGQPSVSYGQPSVSYGQPSVSHGQPSVSHGQPSVSYGQPSVSYGQPSVSYGQPSVSYGQPSVSHGQMVQTSSGLFSLKRPPATPHPPMTDTAGSVNYSVTAVPAHIQIKQEKFANECAQSKGSTSCTYSTEQPGLEKTCPPQQILEQHVGAHSSLIKVKQEMYMNRSAGFDSPSASSADPARQHRVPSPENQSVYGLTNMTDAGHSGQPPASKATAAHPAKSALTTRNIFDSITSLANTCFNDAETTHTKTVQPAPVMSGSWNVAPPSGLPQHIRVKVEGQHKMADNHEDGGQLLGGNSQPGVDHPKPRHLQGVDAVAGSAKGSLDLATDSHSSNSHSPNRRQSMDSPSTHIHKDQVPRQAVVPDWAWSAGRQNPPSGSAPTPEPSANQVTVTPASRRPSQDNLFARIIADTQMPATSRPYTPENAQSFAHKLVTSVTMGLECGLEDQGAGHQRLSGQDSNYSQLSKQVPMKGIAVVVDPPVAKNYPKSQISPADILFAWHTSTPELDSCDFTVHVASPATSVTMTTATQRYIVTAALPAKCSSSDGDEVPDLSLVKDEGNSSGVSLNLREVIDLSTDMDEPDVALNLVKEPSYRDSSLEQQPPVSQANDVNTQLTIETQPYNTAVGSYPRNNLPSPSIDNLQFPFMRESTQASNIREEHTAHPHALPASKAASHSTDASYQQNHHYTHGNNTETTEKDSRSPELGGTMTRHQTMLAQPPQPTGAHRPMKHEPDEDEDDAASTCSSQSSANKSHFGPPSLSSPRAGAPHVLSTIASWSKDEVSSWLRNHHLDKICKNLSNLDAKGLQRMAFEYHRDTDAFYTRVKKTLGLTVFQTLVICRGMKELLGCEDS